MANKIKWVERPNGAPPGATKKIDLLWLKAGELANIVTVEVQGRGWSRKTKTKILGFGVVVRVHMPGKRGYSEVMWNGKLQPISHENLRPVGE
jgi:hypothetical protein